MISRKLGPGALAGLAGILTYLPAMSTPVYWLTRAAADVPPDDAWLAVGEAAHLDRLRVLKRRRDWRLGRWTAKQALAAFLDLPAGERLAILAADDGAPEPFFDGEPLGVAISVSHSGGRALCSVAAGGAALGCDLEAIEERSAAFVRATFTAGERALLAGRLAAGRRAAEQPLLVNLLWSAKESALKALRTGLRLDTRSVEVHLPSAAATGGWRPLEVRRRPAGPTFSGWWRQAGEQVMTVLADPAAAVPVELHQRVG